MRTRGPRWRPFLPLAGITILAAFGIVVFSYATEVSLQSGINDSLFKDTWQPGTENDDSSDSYTTSGSYTLEPKDASPMQRRSGSRGQAHDNGYFWRGDNGFYERNDEGTAKPTDWAELTVPDEVVRGTKITVLMWDGGNPYTWGMGNVVNTPNFLGGVVYKPQCPVDCVFTADRQSLPEADVLLFDACATGPEEYRQLPIYLPDKYASQLWVYFSVEQPQYFPLLLEEDYIKRFDEKMTNHKDAWVRITHVCPWGGYSDFTAMPAPKTNDKFIVWVGSNCERGGADVRYTYIRELMQHISIDSYGGCLHNKDFPAELTPKTGDFGEGFLLKIQLIAQYKFYLAFENTNQSSDYVTEKIINAFQAGTVPVYWGAPDINEWLPGEHSVIKAADFDSPADLARYLRYLGDHEDEYQKYFEWKKKGLSANFQRLLEHCVFYAECHLCKMAAFRKQQQAAIVSTPRTRRPPATLGRALRLNCIDCALRTYDDYVEVADQPAVDLVDNYTIMAWIKLGYIQDGRIVDKNKAGSASAGYEFDIVWTPEHGDGVLRICAAGVCKYGNRPLRVGMWYHVAVVYRTEPVWDEDVGGGIELYVNGKLDSRHFAEGPTAVNDLPLRFGIAAAGASSWRPSHGGTLFDGDLDEISVWQRTLSQQEIDRYMFERPNGDEEGLVAWWHFDDILEAKDGATTQPVVGPAGVALGANARTLSGVLHGAPQSVVSISKPLNDISEVEGAKPVRPR